MGSRQLMVGLMLLMVMGAAPAPSPELRGLEGKVHRPLEMQGKAGVLIFVLHDCPISNGYAPELSRIAAMCRQKGVSFYLLHVDADVKDEELRRHAKEFGYECTVLADRSRVIARRVGATIAPEAFVLDATGATRYQGRIDDLYAGLGQKRREPTRRDLREAIDAVVAGKPVVEPKTQAIGCSIE